MNAYSQNKKKWAQIGHASSTGLEYFCYPIVLRVEKETMCVHHNVKCYHDNDKMYSLLILV